MVLYEGITPGAVDYSAIVSEDQAVRAPRPYIYGGYHPEASKIVTQMRKKNMDIPFVSDDGVKDDTFIKVAKEYAEGVYATGPMDTSDLPLYQDGGGEAQEAFGEEPGAFYKEAYAAAIALLNAIEKAGSTEYAALEKALRSEWVETPVGKISFDERGDAKGVGFSMYQVKDGSYVEVQSSAASAGQSGGGGGAAGLSPRRISTRRNPRSRDRRRTARTAPWNTSSSSC